MPDSLPPEDEIARLRVENEVQGASLRDRAGQQSPSPAVSAADAVTITSRDDTEYFVVDFRKGWARQPYITMWGPRSSGYNWSLPRAGRYTAAELDASGGYHTQRRYVPSRRRYVGSWERFGVPCHILEALAAEPDREGRWRLDAEYGPVVRNSAAVRKHLVAHRYVPRPAPGIETGAATTERRGAEHESPVTEGQAPSPDSLQTQTGREGGD